MELKWDSGSDYVFIVEWDVYIKIIGFVEFGVSSINKCF